jgi:hypothetical protein
MNANIVIEILEVMICCKTLFNRFHAFKIQPRWCRTVYHMYYTLGEQKKLGLNI